MKLFWASICIPGGVYLVYLAETEAWRPATVVLASLGGLMATVVGILTLVWWWEEEMVPLWDMHELRRAEREAVTPISKQIEALSRLAPYQAEAYMRTFAALVYEPGLAGSVAEYDLDGERAPVEFVWEFMEACTDEELRPIRAYPEGTKGREWATIITNFYVRHGVARAAVGNSPARWLYGKAAAVQWLTPVGAGREGESGPE